MANRRGAAAVAAGLAVLAGCNPGKQPGTIHNARTNEQRAMYISPPPPLPEAKPAPAAPAETIPESEAQRLRRENEQLRRENEQLKTQLNGKQ